MVAQHLGAQIIFPCPAAAGFPLEVWIAYLAGLGKVREFSKRSRQDLLVALAVVRRTESAAHGVIDENSTRRGHGAHNIEYRADHQRGNAVTLDDMSDETDGLMAERSIGDKQR